MDKSSSGLEDISMHAVGQIVKAKNPLIKALWLLIFYVSLGVMLLLVSLSIHSFLTHPIVTVINFQTRKRAPFPQFVFCSNAFLNVSKAENLSESLMPNWNGSQNLYASVEHELFRKKLRTVVEAREILRDFGLSCEAFFERCDSYHLPVNCCEKVESKFTTRGHCFLLNMSNASVVAANFNFLQIQIRTDGIEREMLMIPAEWNSIGYRIAIAPDLLGLNPAEWTFINPGEYLQFNLKETEVRKWAWGSERSCDPLKPSGMADGRQIANYCAAKAHLSYCGCTDSLETHPQLGDKFGDYLFCLDPMVRCGQRGTFAAAWDVIRKCTAESFLACSYRMYEVSRSHSYLSEEDRGRIQLGFSFSSLDLVIQEEKSQITLETVIGTIGGTMGVFLGASIITLIEMGMFLISTCYRCCSRLFKNSPE